MVDLDPWLSTLDTTSINPNINTSKTQTVSDNKTAALVLIDGRNVEKLREKHQMCQHNQMLPVYVSIDISSKQVISRSRFLSITWLISGGRGDGGGKAGLPSAAVGDCLWMFVGVFNETLFESNIHFWCEVGTFPVVFMEPEQLFWLLNPVRAEITAF